MIGSSDILKAGILIVDDQEDNITLLEQILRDAGYVSIASTTDPHRVCQLYRQHRYALILLDLHMPDLDGFAVLEGLKAVETDGYLPVLVITAQPDHMLRALKAGAKDFISRPFDPAEVLVRVHNMLELRMLHLEARRRTEQVEARGERAIRVSELKYRQLFEAAKDGILILDFDTGRINDANPFLIELLGFSKSEMVGKTVGELSPSADLESNKVMLERLQKHGYVRYEDLPLQTRDGRKIAVEFVSHMYQAGDRKVIQCNIRDITERRRAQEALRQSEQRLRLFFDSAPAAIAIFDARMCYLSASKRWQQVFQLTGDLTGVSYYATFPEMPERWKQVHQRCLAGAVERSEEDRFLRADGTVTWLKWEAHPWLADGQAVGGIIILCEDITQRKQAEEQMRASREQLRALAARIQAAREEERTHVAREIHDVLAQELTGLQMDAAWLSRRLAEPCATWKQKVLQEKIGAIIDLTDRASQSVQRIAAELRPVVLDSLGLCAATKWVAVGFQKRTKIRCKVSVPSQGLTMDQDRSTALFRILQESLTNVARHAHATKVEIHLWQEADEVILTVRDNGCGVQSGAMKDPHSMGLLGMRERASMLDGRCSISAHAQGGTIVLVRLPIAPILKQDKHL